jgi:hypothetical protein
MVARGRPAHEAPRLLASLFSLCGQAHELCARLAIRAAQHEKVEPEANDLRALQRETQREHIRRICLDWTTQLAPTPEIAKSMTDESHGALHVCPALVDGVESSEAAATARWLGRHVLGAEPSAWLANWTRDRWDWLAHWSRTDSGWLARLLLGCKPWADQPASGDIALRPHADRAALAEFARCLQNDVTLARYPLWRGDCAETGVWTRLHDADQPPCTTAWQRLGMRVAELARLSLPDTTAQSNAAWLSIGALPLESGSGIAWVEMSRGLLIHQVQLEGGDALPRVTGYCVLAPTEWNFHPQGAVARALEAMSPAVVDDIRARVQVLMTAYDPCVRFELDIDPISTEAAHA